MGAQHHTPIAWNLLFLIIGALVVAMAALSYKIYDHHREPKGVQFTIGPSGVSVETK
jgi:hypothetical protein